MSVQEELTTLNNNTWDAYSAIEGKGGTIPQNKNTDNLVTAIESIPESSTEPSLGLITPLGIDNTCDIEPYITDINRIPWTNKALALANIRKTIIAYALSYPVYFLQSELEITVPGDVDPDDNYILLTFMYEYYPEDPEEEPQTYSYQYAFDYREFGIGKMNGQPEHFMLTATTFPCNEQPMTQYLFNNLAKGNTAILSNAYYKGHDYTETVYSSDLLANCDYAKLLFNSVPLWSEGNATNTDNLFVLPMYNNLKFTNDTCNLPVDSHIFTNFVEFVYIKDQTKFNLIGSGSFEKINFQTMANQAWSQTGSLMLKHFILNVNNVSPGNLLNSNATVQNKILNGNWTIKGAARQAWLTAFPNIANTRVLVDGGE